MKKADKTAFQCTGCGREHPKWLGQCAQCGDYNTLVEVVVSAAPARRPGLAPPSAPQKLGAVQRSAFTRLSTGIGELDRVLGGGLVPGQVILMSGEPGIGKSTLTLEAAANLVGAQQRVLYVSGEESVEQIALRGERMGSKTDDVEVVNETCVEHLLAMIDALSPTLVVIDSVQTLYTDTLASSPGSVPQVKECVALLTRHAKARRVVMLFIGHVTKDNAVAGPQTLMHLVDTVVVFDESASAYRILRAQKNRFGAVDIGVFEMTEAGLKPVENPSALFLSDRETPVPGTCATVFHEGTRAIAVEVQALVDRSSTPTPRRLAVGLDASRVAMLYAVLARRGSALSFANQDVYTSVAGGIRVAEPAVDLAVLLAASSSHLDLPVPRGTLVLGEVGLTGEVRPVQRCAERVAEAGRLGFEQIVLPAANARRVDGAGRLRIIPVGNVRDALRLLDPNVLARAA